jgi:hypothetical protein
MDWRVREGRTVDFIVKEVVDTFSSIPGIVADCGQIPAFECTISKRGGL